MRGSRMSFPKSTSLSRLIGLITCNIPARWIRLVYLVAFFAVVLTSLPVHLKHSSANAQSPGPRLTQGLASRNLPDHDETYDNATSGSPGREYGLSARSLVTAQGGGVVTIYPTAYQSPDPGQGGWAINSPSNMGGGGGFSLAYTGGSAGASLPSSSQSSSVDFLLPAGQDLTQVQVSMSLNGGAGPNTTFSGNASVS